jgi:hypothetical protein
LSSVDRYRALRFSNAPYYLNIFYLFFWLKTLMSREG